MDCHSRARKEPAGAFTAVLFPPESQTRPRVGLPDIECAGREPLRDVLIEHEHGTLGALPLDEAKQRLDSHWDNVFRIRPQADDTVTERRAAVTSG